MKSFILVITSFLIVLNCTSQSAEKHVKDGTAYYEQGNYQSALSEYQKALKFNPNSEDIIFKISATYFDLKDYNKAILYAEKIASIEYESFADAALIISTSLEKLGNNKAAIKYLNKTIKKIDSDYRLYSSLAIVKLKEGDIKEAEEDLKKSIELNPTVTDNHFLMAKVQQLLKRKPQAALAAHFFLFLEPNTQRSYKVYEILQYAYGGNVSLNNDAKEINISLEVSPKEDDDMKAATIMLSMFPIRNNMDENKDKSKELIFIENTKSFLQLIGELSESGDKKKDFFWWEQYVPLLAEIANSEHIKTYCYWVMMSGSEDARIWVAENEKAVDDFVNWLKNYSSSD